MKCPYCSFNETKVLDSRESESLEVTRRRRECEKCSKRFTTYERVETDLVVVKKDGSRENFEREKLKAGILKACEKRAVSQEQIESALSKIEAELREKDKSEIPSKIIGDLVMKNLKKLDKVAYIRFASVYRDFKDVDDFEEEVKKLLKR